MKELTSYHDDLEKRLAIFFGLGALILSALIGLMRGYSLEGILVRSVLVLILATLGAWLFGAWLKSALKTSAPEADALPMGMERRSVTPASLEESSLVVPANADDALVSEEVHDSLNDRMSNFTLPELNPVDEAALKALVAAGPAAEAAAAAAAAEQEAVKTPARK